MNTLMSSLLQVSGRCRCVKVYSISVGGMEVREGWRVEGGGRRTALRFTSLWVGLRDDSHPEARKCRNSQILLHTHVLVLLLPLLLRWLCLNELENWSLESHLSKQSEMRL